MLAAYASELARRWRPETDGRAQRLPGTLVFADISGFTKLTERLAARGRFGAEEMSDHLDRVLSALLESAYGWGGWLVKWGGDALLLLFEGPGHESRACLASAEMRRVMAHVGLLDTTVGRVKLRMSVGVNTGVFDFALLGSVHRELLVFGDDATLTANLEATAEAGDVLLSRSTAAALPATCIGAPKGQGMLLARTPPATPFVPAQALEMNPPDGLIPELVLRHLLAGGGSGEHRLVAIGFLEFSGMHRLMDDGGLDAVVDGLAHVVEITQENCRRYGVSFHETDIAPDGGKILLVAGAPHAVADPSEAMLCAIRQVMDDAGSVSLRAGVTLGRVFSGCVGPEFRRSYSVKGDVINLAARIMGKTPAGSLWALPSVTEASRTRFVTSAVEPFRVKGKSAPVTVVSVGEAKTRAVVTDELPMVGRMRESDAIDEVLRRTKSGRGGVVEIVGEIGSGKTRLLEETVRTARDMTVLRLAGEPYRSSSPYFSSRSLLLPALGLAEDCSAPQVIAEIESRLPALQPWIPLFSDLLATSIPDTPQTADIGPRFRRERLQAIVVDVLTAALREPTLVVVDDVQYVDAASADVLRRVALTAPDRPWVIVVARRDNADVEYPATDRLELGPLDIESATALAWAASDENPLPAHVIDRLVAQAAGNPMFLRQLVDAAAGASGDELPDSVDAAVAARIDRLDPPAREVLRAAAVVGQRVERDQLSSLLRDQPSGVPLDDAVDQLAEFLDREVGGWRFRQAVIRDVAYQGLPYRHRRQLHARLAQVLDEQAGSAIVGSSVRSLHHFEAGHHRQALDLARRAGDAAATAYANVEATSLYHRAIEAARRLGDVPAQERAELFERFADMQLRLGEFRRSDQSYIRARRLFGDPERVAAIGVKMARSANMRGDFDLALHRARGVLRVTRSLSNDAGHAIAAEAKLRVAFLQTRQGRLAAARTSCLAVLAETREDELPDVVADALGLLDLVESQLGMPVGDERSRRALQLFERLSGIDRQAVLHNQLGMRAYFAGRWNEALASYRRAEELYRRLGDLTNAATCDANVAEILLDQGRLSEAEPVLLRALRIWRGSGADTEIAFGYSLLGRVYSQQGRFEEAEALLRDARHRFDEQGARGDVVDTDTYLAECLALAHRPVEALAMATVTLSAAYRLSEHPTQAPLLNRVIGACYDQLGDFVAGDEAYAKALAEARSTDAEHQIALTGAAISARSETRGLAPDPELLKQLIPLQRRLGLIDLTAAEEELTSQD